jgi:hypothetical protein
LYQYRALPTYHDKTGAPGIDTRLMVALHYLKYQHDLSDEAVVAGWVENPNAVPLSGQEGDVSGIFAWSWGVKSLLTI